MASGNGRDATYRQSGLPESMRYPNFGKAHLAHAPAVVEPVAVGISLFGRYLLGVELASLLLLAGLVAAYHLARRDPSSGPRGGTR